MSAFKFRTERLEEAKVLLELAMFLTSITIELQVPLSPTKEKLLFIVEMCYRKKKPKDGLIGFFLKITVWKMLFIVVVRRLRK